MAKKMCYRKGTKKVVPEYEFGAQQVYVPPKGGAGDIVNGAATGASLGSAAGPWGTAIGGAVGAIAGTGKMISANNAFNRASQANAAATAYNHDYNRTLDPKNQQFQNTVFANGTSGIHINPANKGKFNTTKERTGETTEELTHSSNPVTKKRAIFAQNAAKWDHSKYAEGTEALGGEPKKKTAKEQSEESRKGRAERFKKTPNVDKKINEEAIKYGKNEHGLPIGDQQFKAEKKTGPPKFRASNEEEYANGTSSLPMAPKKGKIIEVEERELIFQKDPSGKFMLREDHIDSPKHSEGGEDTVGLQGDVIFPANMRSKVMEAYKKGDHSKLESLRQTLPKDEKEKFQDGGLVGGGEEPKKEEPASDHYFYNREDGDNTGIVRYNKGEWFQDPSFKGDAYNKVQDAERIKYYENKYNGRYKPYVPPVVAPPVVAPVSGTPPPKYIPKKPISQISYERYQAKKTEGQKLASVPEFATGISNLHVGTDRINPAALTYTDATDLTHIKGNKNAFNYPPTPSIGYVPSQNVPDAIGYGNYLVSQDSRSGNITPEINSKKMKYKKGTKGIQTPTYAFGTDGLGENYNAGGKYGNPGMGLEGKGFGVEGGSVQEGLMNSADMGSGKPQGMNLNMNKVGNAFGAVAELAPTLYNTARAFSKPVKTQRNFYNPEQYQKVDRFAPARREAQAQYRMDSQNIRNGSGGNQGLFLANQAETSNRRFNRMQDINNQQLSNYQDVDNANTDLRNQAKQTNLGLQNQYNQQDLQNTAQRNNFGAAAATNASDVFQQKRLDRGMNARDESLTGLLGTQNYGIDKDVKGKWKIKYKKG